MTLKTEKKKLLKDLINVFVDIDDRIKMLHKHSSDVFLQLNSYLKDYFKKHGAISTNVTKIFNTTTGSNGNKLSEEFNSIYKELKNYKKNTEKENNANLNLINQLNSQINYIAVIIRNFKQEIKTFTFLTTNFRLILNNEKYEKSTVEIIKDWEIISLKIQENISQLSKKIDSIKSKSNNLHAQTQTSNSDSAYQIFNFYEDLRSSNILINRKERESEMHLSILKKKMESSKESIGNIITHLQYHDIIRQKTEHIQTSHMKIVERLRKEINHNEDLPFKENKTKNFALISDIASLQSAQLILISKEYQKALEVITKNFQQIGNDLTSVSNISSEFSIEEKDSDTTIIKSIKNKLDKSILMLDSYNLSPFNKELIELIKQFETMSSFTVNNIFEPLNQFKLHTTTVGNKLNIIDKSQDSPPSLIFQLISLARDIVDKKDDLKKEIENTIEFSTKAINKKRENEMGSLLEKEQIRLMVKISQILERLDNENRQLDEMLKQNENLSKDIINRLKETINHVDYYELFENVLNEIIQSLNNINNSLNDQDYNKNNFDKMATLQEIEALYTVASERIIHTKVVQGNKEIDIPDAEIESSDLELF